MTSTTLILEITYSRSGIPCLWERGGGMTSGGNATLITCIDGTPPRAIYVPHGGDLSCGNHALIPISPGEHFVIKSFVTKHSHIEIYRIVNIVEDRVNLELSWSWDEDDGWDLQPPACLDIVIETAVRKCKIYHCRAAQWIERG